MSPVCWELNQANWVMPGTISCFKRKFGNKKTVNHIATFQLNHDVFSGGSDHQIFDVQIVLRFDLAVGAGIMKLPTKLFCFDHQQRWLGNLLTGDLDRGAIHFVFGPGVHLVKRQEQQDDPGMIDQIASSFVLW